MQDNAPARDFCYFMYPMTVFAAVMDDMFGLPILLIYHTNN